MSSRNIKALESFREIMRCGSATEAGRRLGITQSAVSRHVSQLEQELKLHLFLRDSGRLAPTADAVALNREIDLALKGLDRVAEAAGEIRRLEQSNLSIVAPPTFVEAVLSDVIAGFVAEHPKVKVTIDSRSQNTAAELVALRNFDCGFVKINAPADNLKTVSVISGGTVCAMPKSHALSSRKKLEPSDLADEKIILLGKGSNFRWEVERAFSEARMRINVAIETHSVGASCALAASGVGIAIVSGILAQNYQNLGLKLVEFIPTIKHEYSAIISSALPPSRITEAFLDYTLDRLKSS